MSEEYEVLTPEEEELLREGLAAADRGEVVSADEVFMCGKGERRMIRMRDLYPVLVLVLAVFVLSLGLTWALNGHALLGPAIVLTGGVVLFYSAVTSLFHLVLRR